MSSLVGFVFFAAYAAVVGFALFWVIRLGVRFALRDHAKWVQAEAKPTPM